MNHIVHIPMSFQNDRHKTPKIEVTNSTKWAVYGTDDKYRNAYPQYLVELFNRSSKHNAIINGKVNYIYGKGNETDFDINADQTFNELLRRVIFDFELFNGFALEIIYGKLGDIAEIRCLDFCNIRKSATGDKLFYSTKWDSVFSPSSNDYKVFDAWNVDVQKTGSYILYCQNYRPNEKVYPFPNYIGAIPYIETDIEVGNFHLNNIRNQFWGGKIVAFYGGEPSEEEKADVERRLKKKFSGSDNAGKFVMVFADSKDRGVEVIDITPSDLDKQFQALNQQVQQEIFSAHNITSPMLFGIRTEGQLGGRTELIEANELFKNVYVNSRVQYIENLFNNLLPLHVSKGVCKLVGTEPISFQFSEQTLVSVMTKDEIREKAGLPALNQPDPNNPQSQGMTNDAVRSLTGRQHQQLLRIIRQYGQGKLTAEAAKTLLRTGLGLSDADITSLLGEQNFSAQNGVEKFLSEHGTPSDKFEVLKQVFEFDKDTEVDELMTFATSELTTIEKKVLKLLGEKQTPEDIAKGLGEDLQTVKAAIATLKDAGMIKGLSVTSVGRQTIENLPLNITTLKIMYSYELRPNIEGGLLIKTSRDFCRHIVGMNKMWDRQEIETLGLEEGYDVFKFAGGWYHNPKTGKTDPECRHQWVLNIVKEK